MQICLGETPNIDAFSDDIIAVKQNGFSLTEMVITLGFFAVLTASALPNLASLKNPLQSGAETSVGFIKQVRAKATSTTNAYFITVDGNDRLVTAYAENCDMAPEERTDDPTLSLDLPTGVTVVDTNWESCFTSRGLASAASELAIQDIGNRTRIIEVFLGGAVRVN